MFINKLFSYVVFASQKYNIDESHGLTHSMDVLNYAQKIYNSEVIKNPYLERQQKIIYTSAILHDMCDKKYMDEKEGLDSISEYIKYDVTLDELDVIKTIIKTMSYSKVRQYGYPRLGQYNLAYHIVREADLLSAYDFNRCMIYGIHKKPTCTNFSESFIEALKLFDTRVLAHIKDGLFITDYSREYAKILHEESIEKIRLWESLYRLDLDKIEIDIL